MKRDGRDAAKRLAVTKTYADYRQMLDEVKPHDRRHRPAVARPASRHGAGGRGARGMHMYMEKPFCRTPAEADEMVAACQKHDVKLALAHQTRYSPKLQVLNDLIDAGKLGRMLELRGRGKEDARGGGEDLWVLGSHVMNLINFFGGDPKWCFARVKQDGQPVTKSDVKDGNEGIGPLAGDTRHRDVRHGWRGDCLLRLQAGCRPAAASACTIYGSKGIVEILTGSLPSVQFLPDPAWSPGRSGKKWVPVSSAGVGKPEPLKDGGLDGGNVLAVKDLLAAIEKDREPECSLDEGRTTIEMISAVFESHRTGGPVQLPLKTRVNPLSLL